MSYARTTQAGYLVVEAYEKGPGAYIRYDTYGIQNGTRLKFYGMRTDARKKIEVKTTGGEQIASCDYTNSDSWECTIERDCDLAIYLYSETGTIQYANYQFSK